LAISLASIESGKSSLPRPLTVLAWLGSVLGLGALLIILVSDLIKPWIRWDAQAYLQLYGITSLATISLLYLRAKSYYEKDLGMASIAYAFFDVLFTLGLIGLIHFGILLPILDPARMARLGSIRVGFNEVLFGCLIMMVIRPLLQIAIRSQERRRQLEFVEVRRMVLLLESISSKIEQLSKLLYGRGESELKRHLDTLLERVEEIRQSITTRALIYTRPVTARPEQILESSKMEEFRPKVVGWEVSTRAEPEVKPSLPDAAIDNPWIEVLRSRKRERR